MKNKNVEYFPYLPYSQIEDNKRCQNILKEMEKDPFTFHKKKSSLMNLYNINLQKDSGENQELLFFQKRHDKDINSYNNFMQKKSSTIEANARNYLKYISHPININNLSKRRSQKDYSSIKENINSNINNLSTLTHSNSNLNIDNKETEKSSLYFNLKKNPTEKNIFTKKSEFIAGNVKIKRSDITNPSYFNEIGEEIMKLNNDVMNYNIKEAQKKLNKKMMNKNKDISISPEKINNRDYYNIGESTLNVNPIINKGSYFKIKLKNIKKYYGRKRTDLMII
jgi:hypothetical protein